MSEIGAEAPARAREHGGRDELPGLVPFDEAGLVIRPYPVRAEDEREVTDRTLEDGRQRLRREEQPVDEVSVPGVPERAVPAGGSAIRAVLSVLRQDTRPPSTPHLPRANDAYGRANLDEGHPGLDICPPIVGVLLISPSARRVPAPEGGRVAKDLAGHQVELEVNVEVSRAHGRPEAETLTSDEVTLGVGPLLVRRGRIDQIDPKAVGRRHVVLEFGAGPDGRQRGERDGEHGMIHRGGTIARSHRRVASQSIVGR